MQRTYGLTVLDETHHIKYTFPVPSRILSPATEKVFSLKEGDQTINLFDHSKVGNTHFMFFQREFVIFDEEEKLVPFKKAHNMVMPTIVLDKPASHDMTIKVIF